MTIKIQDVDTRTASDALLREMHEYYVAVDAEVLPDDPPIPFERRAADWRRIRTDESAPRWLLRDGGEIVASAVAWVNLEQDLANGFGRVHVRPTRRGRGHGRRLAEVLFDRLEAEDRTRFVTYVVEGSSEEALLERAALRPVYREKRSRLVVADVDMGMMRDWIERAGERAAGYRLLQLQSPLPADVLEKYCDLQFQMNTAPMEDFEGDDEVLTPERWREQERVNTAASYDFLTAIAVHEPSGDFVGSTSVLVDRLHPAQGWQWETVVRPEHRNKGLGRLLKAAMLERIVSERPSVERIDTWNAGSNEPMLNINVAMGYAPIVVTNTYQGDLAAVRESLGV
jgi:mycothiol synthase